jgi:hypothetical protein
MDEDAVEKAISQFDGVEFHGTVLAVNRPRQRERERSNSNFSQRGYGNRPTFYTPRDFEEYRPQYRPRRQSIRYYPFNNGPPNLPTRVETSITMGLQSQVSEMVQHQAAVDKFPGPLSSIENLPPKLKPDIEEFMGPVKKENAPIKQ